MPNNIDVVQECPETSPGQEKYYSSNGDRLIIPANKKYLSVQKEQSKVALLLYPHHLLLNKPLVALLLISKKGQVVDYTEKELNGATLNMHLSSLPRAAKEVFAWLGAVGLVKLNQEIKEQYNKQKAGVDYKLYYQKAIIRRLHQIFEQLKPFSKLVKWYCKIPVPGEKRFKIAPCTFSGFKPQLSFEVNEENGGLYLSANLTLNGSLFGLNRFKRNQFLLESNSEYFITGFKDFQTLEWIEQNNPQQYAQNPSAFSKNILAVLESDYTVKRNNLFQQNAIESVPLNRVMLSELNNAFLMLTPQWVYDGFVIEGSYKEEEEIIRNGEPFAVKRNKETEQDFLNLLVSLSPAFEKQKNGFYYLSFADAQKKQWFLKTYHRLLDMDIEIVGMDMLKHFRYSPHKVETLLKVVNETEDSLILDMQVSFGKEKVPLNELQKNLLAGARAVWLKDDSLGILHDEWLQQYSTIVKHGKVHKNEITVARWMAITEQQSAEDERVLSSTIKEEWWSRWRSWQTGQEQVYAVSNMVNASLRPYQQKGYEWIRLLHEAGAGACLADDMGLGKTLQAICFLAHYIQKHPASKSIIVCPASLIYNWQQEIEKFAPSIKSVVYHGVARFSDEWQQKEVQLIITTYGTMRANADVLCETHYGLAVIDESHNIKNPAAQITRAVSRINATMRIALSGTPVVNNTFDLYAQLNFIVPGLFGNREFFKREYADPIDRNADEEKAQALKKLTAPFVLRRTKEQVAKDLPDKTETILWCDMFLEQRELYNEIKERIQSSLFLEIKNKGLAQSKLAVLDGMLKLRQVCNSPLLLKEENQAGNASIKTTVLMEELANILANHKVLVFSQFSSMLNLLAKECTKKGFAYYHFDGQTPPVKRAEMVNAFQEEGNKTNLFLISLKAGNTGLTLTAADYVFIFDPWWNTAVQDQAIDRTHRIGQTKNVFAYKMICKDSIEEKIIRMQEKKKKLSEDLISADEGFVKSLTEEDVQYLFS